MSEAPKVVPHVTAPKPDLDPLDEHEQTPIQQFQKFINDKGYKTVHLKAYLVGDVSPSRSHRKENTHD